MLSPGIVGGKKVLQTWSGNNTNRMRLTSYQGNDAVLYFDSFFDGVPKNYTNSREFTSILTFDPDLVEAFNILGGLTNWWVQYNSTGTQIVGLVVKYPNRITTIQVADGSPNTTVIKEKDIRPCCNLQTYEIVNNSGVVTDFDPQWFKKITKINFQYSTTLSSTSNKDWDFTGIPITFLRVGSPLNSINNLGVGITYIQLDRGTFTSLDISNSTPTLQTLVLNFQFSSNPNDARTLTGLNGAASLTLLELNSMELTQTNFAAELKGLTSLNVLRLDRIDSITDVDYAEVANITNVRITNCSGLTAFPDCSQANNLNDIDCTSNNNMTGTLDLAQISTNRTTINNVTLISCDPTEITFAGINQINRFICRFNVSTGMNLNQSDFENVVFRDFCEFLDAGLVLNNLDLTDVCLNDTTKITFSTAITSNKDSLSGTTKTPNKGCLILGSCIDVTQIDVNSGLKELQLNTINVNQSNYTVNILPNSLLEVLTINGGNVNNLDLSNLVSPNNINFSLRNVPTVSSITLSNTNPVTFIDFSILNDASSSIFTTLTNYTTHTFTGSFTIASTGTFNTGLDVSQIYSDNIDLSLNALTATNLELFVDSLFANRNLVNPISPGTRIIDISGNPGTPLVSDIVAPSGYASIKGNDAAIASAFSAWTLGEKIFVLSDDYGQSFIV